jgi:Na+/proline symporter/signal transduction histidine kinase
MLIIVLAYISLLLFIALRADRSGGWRWGNRARSIGYALSLSVLCTSWTYFGAVGTAVRSGWDFLPNFLGPIIALTVLAPIWRRVAASTKRENVGSVADFIASRYGKSRPLGALIACVAIVGALPYIALQMLSLSKAATLLVGGKETPALVTPLIVAALALLAIVFGARRPTLTQHNRGLTQVVTLEALVKLAGLVTVAVVAARLITVHPDFAQEHWGPLRGWPHIDATFLISTLLCTVTMFTLPRVFHLGFVTLGDEGDVRTGQWLFPLYMMIWAAAIVPIAAAGTALNYRDPDLIVLSLPLENAGTAVTMLALLGGFSAGAAMVMVEAIALSAMISNELILPWIARRGWSQWPFRDVGRTILLVRRLSIVAVLTLGYLYFLRMNVAADLSHLGFASLAASAQLAPALIGGVVWRRGHARGAFWGVIGGMAVWLVAVAAPQLELSSLSAFALVGPASRSSSDLAIVGSLVLNGIIYITVSIVSTPRLQDAIQANAFVGAGVRRQVSSRRELGGTVGDLRGLLERFLGPIDATRGLQDFARSYGGKLADEEAISPPVARAAERMLAGAIGASSARNVIALALASEEDGAADVGDILDEAASAVHFSREVIQAALDSLEQGVSVVDRNLRLMAWNQRYVELFSHQAPDVYIGKPIQELMMQIVSDRARLPLDQAQMRSEERLAAMRRGDPVSVEHEWPDGRILRIVGRGLSTGEYVTSFSDVTEARLAARTLARLNEELEDRVGTRTRQLTDTNAALEQAKELAERVMAAQDRFIGAASHDLMQPMHAARLYLGAALGTGTSGKVRQLVVSADHSIEAADRLLKALLNLSRVEVGGIEPEIAPVHLGSFLAALGVEFQPIAAEQQLDLRVAATSAWGLTNADLLRSALQNLIGNALRYTRQGRVFVAVRRDGDGLRIEVRDSGPGIAADARELIFREYTRLPAPNNGASGTGLGLAIAERICIALGHRLTLRSEPGRGSTFAITLPRASPRPSVDPETAGVAKLRSLRVLCVDDQRDVLEAEVTLLQQWGVQACSAPSVEDALALNGTFDVVLADYHLGTGLNGLDLLRSMAPLVRVRVLVTANASETIREGAERDGILVLRKPISPASLRALLLHASQADMPAS